MANTKEYKIVINGLQESITAVDALNESLNLLDKRIKELEGKAVKVGTSSSGGGSKSSSTSSLSEEEKLIKQINQLEEKRVAYGKDIYQQYLAAKDLLKEQVKDQEELAAKKRLRADSYAKNTMAGMKQELADLKAAINTTDLGDAEVINKMIARANELNDKLKEVEQSYGQFGRNVGNYKSAFDDLKKVNVTIGNTTREFNSVRDASRQLTQELKAMSIAGKEDTKEYKELENALHDFEMACKKADSAVNDLKASSKGMDNVLDTFQSLAAIGQVGQGLSAFFGFDETEIQRSIQKLVALQNTMQGLEKIRQQMNTGEGFGQLFSIGSNRIDSFVSKITGAKVGMDGLTMSSRTATLAVRGFSMALKGIGIGLVVEGISWLITNLTKLSEHFDSTTAQVKVLDESFKTLVNTYKERQNLLSASFLRGEITSEEFLTNQYKLQTEYIAEQINLLKERAAIENNKRSWTDRFYIDDAIGDRFNGERLTGPKTIAAGRKLNFDDFDFKYTVNSIEDVEKAWKECNEAVKENKDYFDKWGSGLSDWVNSLFTTVKDTEKILAGLGNTRLSDFIGQFEEINNKFKDGKISSNDYAQELKKLKAQLNDSEVLQSVIANLDKYIPDEKVRERVNNIIGEIIRLDDAFNMTSPEQVHHWNQVRIDGMKKGSAKIKAQLDEDERYEIEKYGKTEKQIDLIRKKYKRKREEEEEKYNEQSVNKAKQQARELENAEKELNALRIANMNEGLEKQLAQLEEEKRYKLKAVETSGILVGERSAEIEKYYENKILETKKEWAYNIEQVYIDMWNKIYRINHDNAQMNFENQKKEIELETQKLRDASSNKLADSPFTYSDKQINFKQNDNGKYKVEIESDENYTKRLKEEYDKRIKYRKDYFKEIEELSISEVEKNFKNDNDKATENLNNELRALKNSYNKEDREIENHYKKGEITLKQFNEITERLTMERAEKEAEIEEKYRIEAKQREYNKNEEISKIRKNTYDELIEEDRKYLEKLSAIGDNSPVRNGLGIIDVKATKERNNKLIELYKELSNGIQSTINDLEDKLKSKDLTEEQRKRIESLIEILKGLDNQTKRERQIKLKEGDEAFSMKWSEIAAYASQVASVFGDLVGSFGDFYDQLSQNAIDAIEKQIDKYDEMLDKQKDLTQEYADNVNSIEDELSNARGARRQQLIDQLNAQMAAQRASLAEEKKLEKEKDKLEDKKEAEEKKRLKAQQKIQYTQAVVQGAVAYMNALATPPIWVGKALAIATAAATALQLATIASQKFKDGGVIEGKSHYQGGVKVLGGRAEVEGGEFITNKATTAKNVELLEYINSKRKRINLDDMIEFYSDGKAVRKSISSIRTKFADGGQIPTLRNDIDLTNGLMSAFEDYANKPTVVQVVDIVNAQDRLNKVKAMAGLTD